MKKAVIVTGCRTCPPFLTSNFPEGARDAATGLNISIVLIDGQKLAQLMIDHSIGVNIKQRYFVKDIDTDYFNEN